MAQLVSIILLLSELCSHALVLLQDVSLVYPMILLCYIFPFKLCCQSEGKLSICVIILGFLFLI